MEKFISGLSCGLGCLILFVGCIWGTSLCFSIVQDAFGTFIAIISLVLFPALLSLAPLYEGLVNGDWMALKVIYGAAISGGGLLYIGGLIGKDSEEYEKGAEDEDEEYEEDSEEKNKSSFGGTFFLIFYVAVLCYLIFYFVR